MNDSDVSLNKAIAEFYNDPTATDDESLPLEPYIPQLLTISSSSGVMPTAEDI